MITIVHPYYNHKDTFQYQFNNWTHWSASAKKRIEIIIVDDGSPDYPCIPPKDTCGVDLKVLRIEENIMWNTAGAANLGISEAKYDWILHADFDIGLAPRFSNNMIKLDLSDPRVMYWPQLYHTTSRNIDKFGSPHCNGFLMHKDTFWEAGGFDEDFSGSWGYQDSMFHLVCIPPLNLKHVTLKNVALERMIRCKDSKVQNIDRDRFNNKNETKLRKKWLCIVPHSTDYLRFSWHQVYP